MTQALTLTTTHKFPLQDTWKKIDFSHGTRFHSLTKVDHEGNVLIASGGYNSDSSQLSDRMVIMNPQGVWETFRGYTLKSPMQKHCEVSNANGTHIWVIGGVTDSQAAGRNTVSKLDLKTKQWEDLADFPKDVFDAACVYDDSQDKIYVAAGKDFYALRIADNVWDTLTEIPVTNIPVLGQTLTIKTSIDKTFTETKS